VVLTVVLLAVLRWRKKEQIPAEEKESSRLELLR
jgi:hypothetical protein